MSRCIVVRTKQNAQPQFLRHRKNWGWAFCEGLLHLADLDRVRAFRRVRDFEGKRVALTKRIKGNSNKLVRVEKEVFHATLDLDEAKPLIGEAADCSCLHTAREKMMDKYQYCSALEL